MDDLVTWLRQQLDDDEQSIRTWGSACVHIDACDETGDFMERFGEDRMLAEVDAKRRIMTIHNRRADVFPDDAGGAFDNCCDGCGYEGICDDPVTEDINRCPILRALALPYADRPGYRDEWRLNGRAT